MTSPRLFASGTVSVTAGQKRVTLNAATVADINFTEGDDLQVLGNGSRLAIDALLPELGQFDLLHEFDGATAVEVPYTIYRNPGGWGSQRKLSQDLAENVRKSVELINKSPLVAYDLSFRFGAAPIASEVIDFMVTARAMTLAAAFAGSRGYLSSPPGATFTMTLRAGGSMGATTGTNLGTIKVSPEGDFTFATAGNTQKAIAAGTLLKLVAPATADPAIAKVAFTLFGWTS